MAPDTRKSNSGMITTIKSMYNDPFRWSFIKSWTMFAIGVWISREMTGVDLMAPPTTS